MAFVVEGADCERSPKTGMSRRLWLEAARFLLRGVLHHVKSADQPVVMPGESPPKPGERLNMEAMARTFMLAAPVIAGNSAEIVEGIQLRDYYAAQILSALDPRSPHTIGGFCDETRRRNRPVCGHTVEGAALCVGMWLAGEALWGRFSRVEQDLILDWLVDVAHGRTNSHNWRWFNVLIGAFAASKGRPIDPLIMDDHLQNLIAWYAGDGWYLDGAAFDFYSAWAFQFYAPIWCRMWGYEHRPDAAAILERYHLDLQLTYWMMFGRDGHCPMWGRSIIYRCAAAAPLAAGFLLNRQSIAGGFARRIASGNLLQFITRDDVFDRGVPTLGFYRAFAPVVQSYSSAPSPYWLSKLFVALALPEESPFWAERESDGEWEGMGRESRTVSLPGPGMTLTSHGSTGAGELRPGKVNSRSSLLYTRLVYNTAFPGEDDNPAGATTCCYSARQLHTELPFAPSSQMRYRRMRDGVLYRQSSMGPWMARADLADIIVPGGVLRVDRVSLPFAHDLRLGHFALPHVGGELRVAERQIGGRPVMMAHAADGRALAMVAYMGWDGVSAETHAGLNPEADRSTVLFAHRTRATDYTGLALMVTLLLHRTDAGEWSDEELSPVVEMEYLPWAASGSPCGLRARTRDGRELVLDFGGSGDAV